MDFNLQKPTGAAAKPLSTAAEIALEKTAPSPTPLSDKVISELFRTTGPTVRHFPTEIGQPVIVDLARFVEWMTFKPASEWVGDQWPELRRQMQAQLPEGADPLPEGLMVQTMFALCTPEELSKLRDIQARQGKAIEAMAPFAMTNVGGRMAAMQAEHDAAVLAGTNPVGGLMPTRDMVARDSLARLSSYEALLRKITHEEVAPICKAILGRFNTLVSDFMRRVELADREACAIQGIEYQPSVQWRCAASVLIGSQVRLPQAHTWSTPRQILKGIVEI